MGSSEETEARTKLISMSWNDLRKEAKINGIKANIKKAPLIEAILHKIAAKQEASGDSVEIIGVSEDKFVQSSNLSEYSGSNNRAIKTGRTFEYLDGSNLESEDTGDLADDEATAPNVSSKKLSFIEFQDEDESASQSGKESQMNTTMIEEKEKPDEDAANIGTESVVVNPLLSCGSPQKKEINMNFTEDETSSLSDEETQLNTTYDLPQNDEAFENNELGTVDTRKSAGEPMEIDSPVEVEDKKSGNSLVDNIFGDEESLVNFETVEGAIEGSGRMKLNNSLMLYTSTPLLSEKTLPVMHDFGSIIQNPLSKRNLENYSEMKLFDTNSEVGKGVHVQNTTPSECASTLVKPNPPSVQFKFGSASSSSLPKVVGRSILKRSSMSANRVFSMQNSTSKSGDCKRMTVGASGSGSRLSRLGSAPVVHSKPKYMSSPKLKFIDLNSSGGASDSREKSGISRDRSGNSRLYTPYSGPFRYKDTSKMRDAELENYNREKLRHQGNKHISKNLFS